MALYVETDESVGLGHENSNCSCRRNYSNGYYSFSRWYSPNSIPSGEMVVWLAFAGLSILSLVLIGVQAHKTDKDQERAEGAQRRAEDGQKESQQKLDQTQQKVIVLEGQVSEIHKKVFEPGTPTEKLDKVLSVLGVQTSPVTSIQFNRLIPFKAGAHQVFQMAVIQGRAKYRS